MNCHGAATQALDLRENKPHPVSFFAAVTKFPTDFCIHRILRVDKPLQVERVGHNLDFAAAFESFGHRDFVGVFEVTANW